MERRGWLEHDATTCTCRTIYLLDPRTGMLRGAVLEEENKEGRA